MQSSVGHTAILSTVQKGNDQSKGQQDAEVDNVGEAPQLASRKTKRSMEEPFWK